AGVPAVSSQGQGGLLDLALGPGFANDRRIYFTFAEPVAGGLARAAVARATLGDTAIDDVEVIYRQVPAVGGGSHFGGRLVFDRFGYLFVTLGERYDPDQAQRMQVALGKVIRIFPDGSIPPDNPALMPDSVDTGRDGVLHGRRTAGLEWFSPGGHARRPASRAARPARQRGRRGQHARAGHRPDPRGPAGAR